MSRSFLRTSLVYFVIAVVIAGLTKPGARVSFPDTISMITDIFSDVFADGWIVLVVAGAVAVFRPREMFLDKVRTAVVVLVSLVLFLAGFTLIKTSMPFILPFYADPMLARIDMALSFGTDPWIFAHAWLGAPGLQEALSRAYVEIWLVVAFIFPVVVILVDDDDARIARFLGLYVLAWVLIGNVLALAFLSAGPIYYDRLHDGTRFAELTQALVQNGFAVTTCGRIQNDLWYNYVLADQNTGAGISAFPSVHVAVATVVALYLFERNPWSVPLGIAFVGFIEVMSVYTGYHYAVDGLVSIAVILVAWTLLRRGILGVGAEA